MPKRTREWNYARRQRRRVARSKTYKSRVIPYKSAYFSRKPAFKKAVMSVVNRNAEVKTVMRQLCSNFELRHNVVQNIDSNAFFTNVGTWGEQQGESGTGSRVGHRAFLKGIRVSLNIESQQYRPAVNYWLYLVRYKNNLNSAIDAATAMFEGVSTTLPCDFIDSSKVDVLFCKKFKPRMPNMGTTITAGANGQFDVGKTEGVIPDLYEGIYSQVTNPQIIEKFYVPLNRTVLYGDAADATFRSIPASYRYQWVMVTYDNFASAAGSTTYPAGHITMTTKLNFTDV